MPAVPDDLITYAEAAAMTRRTLGTVGRWVRDDLARYNGEMPEGGGNAASMVSLGELRAYCEQRGIAIHEQSRADASTRADAEGLAPSTVGWQVAVDGLAEQVEGLQQQLQQQQRRKYSGKAGRSGALAG
jgi:hypothetical protein